MTDYIMDRHAAGDFLTVESQIAYRRAEERYCQKVAQCRVARPDEPDDKVIPKPLQLGTAFSSCLEEEARRR